MQIYFANVETLRATSLQPIGDWQPANYSIEYLI